MRSSSNDCIKRQDNSGKAKDKKCYNSSCNKIIKVVGIGPGSLDHMSQLAKDAICDCEVVVGYKKYIELIEELIRDKEVYSTAMMGEIKRCESAIEYANNGKRVCVVCSGDSGIYGLAGLILEILDKKNMLGEIDVEVIPGIPAFVACASLLGAPIVHDFASVSLSDLLTPWEVIEKRLEACGQGDFVTIIYNPKSKKRNWQFSKAIEILKRYRSDKTPVGIVKNAARENEEIVITTIGNIDTDFIDMFTLVIIGNSTTKNIGKYIVTPRGYLDKYQV